MYVPAIFVVENKHSLHGLFFQTDFTLPPTLRKITSATFSRRKISQAFSRVGDLCAVLNGIKSIWILLLKYTLAMKEK